MRSIWRVATRRARRDLVDRAVLLELAADVLVG